MVELSELYPFILLSVTLIVFQGQLMLCGCYICIYINMGGTSPAIAGFQDSDFFQKAIKMVLKYSFTMILHLLGFTL